MGKLSIPTLGKKGNTEHPKVNAAIEALNAILGEENKVKGSGLEAGVVPFKLYPPVVISKEESRSGSSGLMGTPDEVPKVSLSSNGLIVVLYYAKWKSSVSGQGFAGMYLDGEEIDGPAGTAAEGAFTNSTAFRALVAAPAKGLENVSGETGNISVASIGGMCVLQAPEGTHTVSVHYGSLSGTVSAKERKLWVLTLG